MKEYSEVTLRRQGQTGATLIKYLKPGDSFAGMQVERLLVNDKGELIVWLKKESRSYLWLSSIPALTKRSSPTHLAGLPEDLTHSWKIELSVAA